MPNTISDPLELENQTRQFETVVALLPSKVRNRARDILNKRGRQRVQVLSRVIAKEQAKRRVRAKITNVPGSLFLIACLVVALRQHTLSGYVATLFLSGLTLLVHAAASRFPGRLERASQEALLYCKEPESVGPILESLTALPLPLRQQAYDRLIDLLPQLTPETFQKLSPTQRSLLHALLNSKLHTNIDLRLSVLDALGEAGDKSCLGIVYLLATSEPSSEAAKEVRDASRECIERLFARLNFGPLENIPRHVTNIGTQLRVEETNFQEYATSFLSLTRLLPQLTPSNYKSILSTSQRNHLYGLLMAYAASGSVMSPYRRRNLHLEIIRTAERMGDIRATNMLNEFAGSTIATSDEEIYAAITQALSTLETLTEQES